MNRSASSSPPRHVAFLGLGSMGSRMATRIADAGRPLVVWNRSPVVVEALLAAHPGVSAAPSPAAAADGAEVIVAMVSDDAASRAVWIDAGVLDALDEHAVAIEASTVRPAWIRQLSADARSRDRDLIEAPVIGSRPQAEAGALVTLAAGDAAAIERARPVLDAYSGAVRAVGDVGDAATLKLAVNALFGMQVAAYSEIVGLLERSSVDTAAAIEVLGGLPITSPGLQRVLGLIDERDFRPNFPVPLVAKDFGYLVDTAAELGAAVPVASATADVYAAGAAGAQAQLDIAGIAARYL